jgi:hypothetical protein
MLQVLTSYLSTQSGPTGALSGGQGSANATAATSWSIRLMSSKGLQCITNLLSFANWPHTIVQMPENMKLETQRDNLREGKPTIFLVDMDGTLAVRLGGEGARQFYDWNRVGEDEPNLPVVRTIQCLQKTCPIVVVSGRDECCRCQTEMWLAAQSIQFLDLYMRPRNDNRPDTVVKRELYERYLKGTYEIIAVFDDRNNVVSMWRSLGLACFQVAEGDF